MNATLHRDVLVTIRLTSAERSRWRRIAHRAGQTVAEVVRGATRDRLRELEHQALELPSEEEQAP